MTDNFNYDTFVRNPPNPVDIYNFSEHESLFTTLNSSPIPNSFNISSFNVNGLRHNSQVKIEQISNFFNLKHISFGDKTKQVKSTGGVSLFIEKTLASHVQDFMPIILFILTAPLLLPNELIVCYIIFYLMDMKKTIPVNASDSLGTFHRDDQVTRIDYVWSFTDQQWEFFSAHTDSLCDVPPSTFSTWHINQQCEYLHSRILKAANASLPSVTVGNQHTPTMPKDLEALTQHYRFLSRLFAFDTFIAKYPSTYYNRYERTWSTHFIRLQNILHLYKKAIPSPPTLPKKIFQDSSIHAKLDDRDNNFETDISSFIDSALSRTRRHITLDRVFIDHPTHPKLLTDPHDIDDAVIDHFQNSVPMKSSPPENISALPERWSSAYHPMDNLDPSIYNFLLDPPTLEEWVVYGLFYA
ncbi:hypothetical protein GLOIN_2v1770668 [Rhizophagus irregularis DAOM 181602=DAOM 197198]|nr:hypothetical protein GLOIN_2v1770668 [Rhizophagus irregularis DAOM 181602=DAOM 197198]